MPESTSKIICSLAIISYLIAYACSSTSSAILEKHIGDDYPIPTQSQRTQATNLQTTSAFFSWLSVVLMIICFIMYVVNPNL